jgi:curved DNA-binding protein CbpA
MDSKSPLFDRIRIKPSREETKAREHPCCEWQGCDKPGLHRAPKGRGQEGKYWLFCVEHVRQYNHSYNYFNGMNDEAVAAFQKDATIGHRPTWSMGVNPATQAEAVSGKGKGKPRRDWDYADPLGIMGEKQTQQQQRRQEDTPRSRHGAIVRRAFDIMGLEENANPAAIKAQYKLLVKRFHPDANGGDRGFEERLRDIIKAHDTLKAAGLC